MSLSPTWRRDAALAYFSRITEEGLTLDVRDGYLLLPVDASNSEKALARLLKPELMALLKAVDPTLGALCAVADNEEAEYLRQERAAILEHDAGLPRDDAESRAGIPSSMGVVS